MADSLDTRRSAWHLESSWGHPFHMILDQFREAASVESIEGCPGCQLLFLSWIYDNDFFAQRVSVKDKSLARDKV